MKKDLLIIPLIILFTCLSAQNYKPVTVKAGKSVLEYFPFKERYLYPEFRVGRVILKNGNYSETRLNYNILMADMEFIRSKDTLSISNKKEVRMVIAASDTFFYDNGYLKLISGGPVIFAVKDYIKLKEVQKKDPYGVSSSGSARESSNVLPSETNFYRLKANDDMVFQRTNEYYIAIPSSNFVPFRKKNVLRFFPHKEKEIKNYLKSNKINFNSREDVLKLADYLRRL